VLQYFKVNIVAVYGVERCSKKTKDLNFGLFRPCLMMSTKLVLASPPRVTMCEYSLSRSDPEVHSPEYRPGTVQYCNSFGIESTLPPGGEQAFRYVGGLQKGSSTSFLPFICAGNRRLRFKATGLIRSLMV